MALPNEKETFKNLFPDITVDDIPMVDLWRAWQISQEFRGKVKIFDTYLVQEGDRWETIAQEVYNDRRLWWILVMFNDIEDPFSIYFEKNMPQGIKSLKIIQFEDVGVILNEIRNKRLQFET